MIIVALDFDSPEKALDLAAQIRGETGWVKVGLELFIRSGPEIVSRLKELNFSVFLDLKLMDIPNTVSRSVAGCVDLGADMITVHVLGGEKMVKSAVTARDMACLDRNHRTKILGITLLTSLNRDDLAWPEQRQEIDIVCDLAGKAFFWGLDGCVCSGLEAAEIRKNTKETFCLVTPGIRVDLAGDDQKRIVSPKQARQAGADYLVVGRPVTRAPDPVAALRNIRSQLTKK